MIELSSVFQQYVVEYIFTQPGSSQEERWFSKIIDSFGLSIEIDSRLISKPYFAQFVSVVAMRKNPNHIARLKRQIEKRTEAGQSTDIAEPMLNVLLSGNGPLNKSMSQKFRKLRISMPVYLTNPNSASSLVNPYEEFVYWAIDAYYDSINITDCSASYVKEIGNKYLFNKLSAAFDNSSDVFVGELDTLSNTIPITNSDDEVVCWVSVGSSPFVVSDSRIGEKRNMFYIDFRKNNAFDYMFDNPMSPDPDPEAAATGSVFYINDIMGMNNQLRMLCCMIRGLANFSQFKRVHKKNSGTMAGIQSYCKSVFTFGGTYNIVYGYDEAYLTYRCDDEHPSETLVISYKGYVEDIDAFVSKHSNEQ